MSTDDEGTQSERGSGRPPRVGDSRSPVGSTLSIVLAVVAVVAGFLILRAITNDDDDGSTGAGIIVPDDTGGGADSSAPTSVGGSSTAAPTSSIAPAPVKTGATVVVANASGVGGSAGTMSTALASGGYAPVGEPGNATGNQLTASVVYYVATDPAAQAVAQTLGVDLGGVEVLPLPDPRPASGGDVDTATVLVMLGTDAANKTLAELNPTAVAAPGVAGASTTSTTTG